MHGSDPPACVAHGGSGKPPALEGREPLREPVGVERARPGERELRPGFYAEEPSQVTVDQAIAGLVHKMALLDEIIARAEGNGQLVRLFEL